MEAGGERRYLGTYTTETDEWTGIVAEIGSKRLSQIDQAIVDDVARKLLPDGKPQTRNRQVYTPISAVLKHAGVFAAIRRPKGAMGEERTDWLWPEQAFCVIQGREAQRCRIRNLHRNAALHRHAAVGRVESRM